MNPAELKERTIQFAVRGLKLADALPPTASFINKITIALEEADETGLWLEITERATLLPPRRRAALAREADELTRIFNATRVSARSQIVNRKS